MGNTPTYGKSDRTIAKYVKSLTNNKDATPILEWRLLNLNITLGDMLIFSDSHC